MVNYNELFGGNTIAPAQLSYTSYTLDASIALQWPLNAEPDADFAAQKIDVLTTLPNLSVMVPPANEVSTGTDLLFNNVGSYTFSVLDADGNVLGAVASGEVWYFYLTDNTTAAGTWDVFQFGAGTSAANAASLAGAGLIAVVTTLNQNLPTTHINADYGLTSGDRATVILSEGGVTMLTPDSPAALGDGWFVYVINAGSGALTFDGNGATVDGAATKTINPSESAVFFSDGANFWTLGYGRSIQSTVTATTINLAAETSPLTLSAAQVAAQVQDYTGALTGNFIVNYGTGVGYWFVRNNTSGAFSLTLRVNGSDAGVAIAQGSYSIVRSNGSNLVVAFTATSGTVTQVNTGTGLTGGPITTTGTISLANTAVTPGSYGSASETLTATVDQQGRLTALADTPIAITKSQVTNLVGQYVSQKIGIVFPTVSTEIPYDNSIPQQSEGTEILTVTITPQSATSTLVVDVVVNFTADGIYYVTAGLFRDGTANALAAAPSSSTPVADAQSIVFRWDVVSGSTSATTFKVRIGVAAGSGGTITINGVSGAQRLGGVYATSLSVQEIG